MKNYKVSALVVTYNRKEFLRKNLTSLVNQTYKIDTIFVVDNCSTDGTRDYVDDIIKENDNIRYITLNENIGGSGGFHEGFKAVLQENFDFLWGMDDDAIPKNDALEKMILHAQKYTPDDKVAFYSNIWFLENIDDINSLKKELMHEDMKKVYGISFVGFLLPRKLVEKCGLPRKDLFIFWDEVEYSDRIRENNYEILSFRDSVIYHPYVFNPLSIKIFNKTKSIFYMPPWKYYYYIRNDILTRKSHVRYKENHFKYWVRLSKTLIGVLLLEPKAFGQASRGFVHGILGLSGKRH